MPLYLCLKCLHSLFQPSYISQTLFAFHKNQVGYSIAAFVFIQMHLKESLWSQTCQ